MGHFWPLLKWASFFETTGAVEKIGLSLKLNQQINLRLSKSLIHMVNIHTRESGEVIAFSVLNSSGLRKERESLNIYLFYFQFSIRWIITDKHYVCGLRQSLDPGKNIFFWSPYTNKTIFWKKDNLQFVYLILRSSLTVNRKTRK